MNARIDGPDTNTTHVTHEDGMGGSITILQRGDEREAMRFRMILPQGFGPPAPECHPHQREDFRILRGTLGLGEVDGKPVVLRTGDTFTLGAGTFHLPANKGDDELEFEATLTPGHDAAAMFESLYTVTREYSGLGRFVRTAMVFRCYPETISFPVPVRTLMGITAGIGRLLGLRAPQSGTKPRHRG